MLDIILILSRGLHCVQMCLIQSMWIACHQNQHSIAWVRCSIHYAVIPYLTTSTHASCSTDCTGQSLLQNDALVYHWLKWLLNHCLEWDQWVFNSNSNSHDNVYGAVIVAVHCHCESSPGSSDECSTQRQVAANHWTKPISLSQWICL